MARASSVVAAALLLAVSIGSADAAMRAPALPEGGENASARRTPGSGEVRGVVTDAEGAPLDDTLISATGPSGTALTVCDAKGRFEFRGLVPGVYLLRTHHADFAAATRHVVEVQSGRATIQAVTLRRVAAGQMGEPFLAAGMAAPRGRLLDLIGVEVEAAQRDEGVESSGASSRETEASDQPAASGAPPAIAPHDDTDKGWWLRRTRRSVLKDADGLVAATGPPLGPVGPMTGLHPRAAAHPGSGADLSTGLPFSGQLHLLTRASVGSLSQMPSTNILPGQIAYVSLGGPEERTRWGFQGGVRTGDAGSLVLAGSYVAELAPTHAVILGASYSRQDSRAPAADPTRLTLPSDTDQPSDPTREVGSVSAHGRWEMGRRVAVDYGVNVARYGYVSDRGLYSPRATLTYAPRPDTRVRVAASQHMLAPGAEEFLPPMRGVWLPPERTFAALAPGDALQAERTQHLEVALERDIGRSSTVGVRRFVQDVDDQMVTLFGARPALQTAGADHYYLANASGVSVQGWGVVLSHLVASRVRGTVRYSLMDAEWMPWAVNGLSPVTVGVLRAGHERFHDVTTSVETDIPETATSVLLLYRVNSAFSVAAGSGEHLTPGVAGRFALRVRQTLPFSPIEGSDWEVLVDVRSLFREQVAGASMYDELLVVSPPKQVVGGLVVHF